MRLLYVIEVIEGGEFQPKVGFAEKQLLTAWMDKYLSTYPQLSDTNQWRIVQYVPSLIANGPMPN